MAKPVVPWPPSAMPTVTSSEGLTGMAKAGGQCQGSGAAVMIVLVFVMNVSS
jgi:hypothetical protein